MNIKGKILSDTEDYVDVCVGVTQWQSLAGLDLLYEDLRVKGEVWRVHKGDKDPFPSAPHAHCIDGPHRYLGCKLHLGTRELFCGHKGLGIFLDQKQSNDLIELIQPKFPSKKLPLSSS